MILEERNATGLYLSKTFFFHNGILSALSACFCGTKLPYTMICESTYNLQALVHTLVAEWPGDLQQSS